MLINAGETLVTGVKGVKLWHNILVIRSVMLFITFSAVIPNYNDVLGLIIIWG